MKRQKLAELTQLLRYQQSLLNLSVQCASLAEQRKRPAVTPSRTLAQLARKVESQAS